MSNEKNSQNKSGELKKPPYVTRTNQPWTTVFAEDLNKKKEENTPAETKVTALLSSAAPANDGASLLLDNVPADFDGRTLSLTNERVLVKDGDSEVVFAPASYNADDIQFTDTKQTLSGFTVARSDYADSDSSKTYLVEGTDHNFLAVTNNEDLLNSILQVQ